MAALGMKTMLCSTALALALVTTSPAHARDRHEARPIAQATAEATERLGKELRLAGSSTPPLLVLSAQNMDDLSRSEGVGRLVGELVQTRLVNQGYRVKEVRLRDSIRVSPEGEQGLSRDLARLAQAHAAEVVVVSTYTRSARNAFVTVKAVRVADGLILASQSFVAQVPAGL